jgi:hypothetical protein
VIQNISELFSIIYAMGELLFIHPPILLLIMTNRTFEFQMSDDELNSLTKEFAFYKISVPANLFVS